MCFYGMPALEFRSGCAHGSAGNPIRRPDTARVHAPGVTASPSLAPPSAAFNAERQWRQDDNVTAKVPRSALEVPSYRDQMNRLVYRLPRMQKALYACIRGRPQALRMSAPPSPHAHERPEPPPAAHFFSASPALRPNHKAHQLRQDECELGSSRSNKPKSRSTAKRL